MANLNRIFVVLSIVLMVLTTSMYAVVSRDTGRFVFSGQSNHDAFDFFGPIPWLSFTMLALYLILQIDVFRGWISGLLKLLVVLVWALSFRTLNFEPAVMGGGGYTYGWLYLPSGEIPLCGANRPCDQMTGSDISVSPGLFWTVDIQSPEGKETLFVGPFLRTDFLTHAQNRFIGDEPIWDY